MKKLGIGIDLGGTKILGVLTNENGKVLKSIKEGTGNTNEGERIISTIVAIIEKLKEGFKVKSVGIGCAGFIDYTNGVVHESPNIKFLKNFPLGKTIYEKIKIPVFVDNDVKAGCVAEIYLGGGKNTKNFVYVTLGTGIGGCIVHDGKIVRGANNMAGEVGHITIDEFGPLCGCGKRGCVEALASGLFIKNYFIHGVKRGIKTSVVEEIEDIDKIDVPLIAKHARKGDLLSLKVLRTAAKNIGLMLSIIINILNPEKIIIGGGLLNAIDIVFEEMIETARLHSLKIPFESVKIEKSSVGEEGVAIGSSIMGILRSEGMSI